MTKHSIDGGEIGGHPENNNTNTPQLQTPGKHLSLLNMCAGHLYHCYTHAVCTLQSSNVPDIAAALHH